MRRQGWWRLAAGLMVLAGLALPRSLAAAEGINLQVSPLPIELTTEPGHSVATDLRVRNAGSVPETLQVRLLKVTEDDNGNVFLAPPGPGDDFVHWVQFSKTQFDAPPNQWQTIHMTVNVPSSAAFGYYFAVEYLRATATPPAQGQIAARGAVATFILLNANVPGATREAQVVSFTADHGFYEFLPSTFTVKLRSTGNVHVAPHGNVFIMSGSKTIATLDINSAQGNILPKSSRFFSTSWTDGFPHYEAKTDASGQSILDKSGKPEMHLVWNFNNPLTKIRFGHYTAKLLMVYDNGQRDVPLEASVNFWVVPWRLLLVLVVILGLPLFLGYKYLRLRRRLKELQKKTA